MMTLRWLRQNIKFENVSRPVFIVDLTRIAPGHLMVARNPNVSNRVHGEGHNAERSGNGHHVLGNG